MGQVVLLTEVARTGSAEIRADGGVVILKYFDLGDTVQIVAEEGFAPEIPGYTTILEDGVYAYVPTAWVRKSGDEEFKQWDGFAGYSCYLYDNYKLRGGACETDLRQQGHHRVVAGGRCIPDPRGR